MNIQINKEDIESRLISIISNSLRIDKENITPDSRIINDLNAESLDILDIRFSIEQEFGFKMGEHELFDAVVDGMSRTEFSEIFTVLNLTDFVESKFQTLIPQK